MRIGHAVKDQKERLIERGDQIRQIVLLILTSGLHAGNNSLMNGAFAFLIQKLAAGDLNHHTLRFQSMDQRHKALILAAFQNKDFLETLRSTLQQRLHRVDAVNHFTHLSTRLGSVFSPFTPVPLRFRESPG